MSPDADFAAENHGSVWLLRPLSDAGREWCDEHLPEDSLMWGDAYAVDQHCITAIVMGMLDDSLLMLPNC